MQEVVLILVLLCLIMRDGYDIPVVIEMIKMIMHVDYVMYNKYMIYIQDYQLTHSMIKHKGTHVPATREKGPCCKCMQTAEIQVNLNSCQTVPSSLLYTTIGEKVQNFQNPELSQFNF